MPPPDTRPDRCPNCGAYTSGRFCAECGQRNQALRQSTLAFLREGFNEYFGVDSRLWRTLRLLLFRPGALTNEHIAGRRTRYLGPLRLYLSASVLFFFLLSVLDPAASLERQLGGSMQDSTVTVRQRLRDIDAEFVTMDAELEQARLAADSALTVPDSVLEAARMDTLGAILRDSTTMAAARSVLDGNVLAGETEIVTDLDDLLTNQRLERSRLTWQRSVLENWPPDSTIRPVDLIDASHLLFPGDSGGIEIDVPGGARRGTPLQRFQRARTTSERSAAVGDMVRTTIERVPIVLFFMLPMFAFVLKLVYLRRDWFYSEHLVFALHNHALAFLGFSVMAGIVAVGGAASWVTVLIVGMIAGLLAYFLVAQKRVYGQGWGKTLVKYAIAFWVYWGIITFFGLTLLLILATAV